jgi:predicted Na+-dependent transporter
VDKLLKLGIEQGVIVPHYFPWIIIILWFLGANSSLKSGFMHLHSKWRIHIFVFVLDLFITSLAGQDLVLLV